MYRSIKGNIVELVAIHGNNVHVKSQGIVSVINKKDFEANYEEIKND